MSGTRPSTRALPAALAVLLLAACSGGTRETDGTREWTGVRHGRLVDVYGTWATEHGEGALPHERDVLVGHDVAAAATTLGCRLDGAAPDSNNPRIVIPHAPGSTEFAAVLARLRASAVPIRSGAEPARVPRDAVFELEFSGGLETDALPVACFADGRIVRRAHPSAVGLRRLPSSAADTPVPARVMVRGDRVLVDPVVSSAEAQAWQLPATDGLRAAPGEGVDFELCVALGGPTSLPGVASSRVAPTGRLPLRVSGASGASITGLGPRLLGAMTLYLEAVDDVDAGTQRITLFKNGIVHDIDGGDIVRVFVDQSGIPVVVTEIVADPVEDRGKPAVGTVRALVARTPGLREIDPRRLPNYPRNPRSAEGERWLVQNAPRAVLVAEFIAERRAPSGTTYGDDPRLFVQWSPAPIEAPDDQTADRLRQEPCDHVSPFAGAIVRFSQPIDPATVRALDTLFFATRDVLDVEGIREFVERRGIDPQAFNPDKYRTPHLIAATALPIDGSNTAFRLQTPFGFWLDEAMRRADEGQTFATKRHHYHLHVLGGANGIRDRAGNALDLQWTLTARDHVVIPFALDVRRDARGVPLFPDNHAVSHCRRFASRDEDEQPSYHLDDEVPRRNAPPNPAAYPLDDLFGAVLHVDGRLAARPSSRMRRVADDLNQLPPPPQSSELRWCPEVVRGEAQIATATATVRFGIPILDPSNPYGCRLQTLWREIDLDLSRTDPFDFNLDVEAVYWGIHTGSPFVADVFERTSLWLGHGEVRPEPCVSQFSALPSLTESGPGRVFADNYAHDLDRAGNKEHDAPPHPAFVDQPWVHDPASLVFEPSGVNRYAPAPAFQRPYFVWRDERVMAQGGNSHLGSDLRNPLRSFEPYIISPFLQGQGRCIVRDGSGQLRFQPGKWSNAENHRFGTNPPVLDRLTGGSVGAIALPLLVDAQVDPYEGSTGLPPPVGQNGWQVALPVQSSALPAFRAYSAGGVVQGQPRIVDRNSPAWFTASGGVDFMGLVTPALDNTFYWAMFDFAKTTTVVTAGFVDLLDPHRMPDAPVDPRLGPFFGRAFPAGKRVRYAAIFDPPLDALPPGTSIVAEYRAAGEVDPQPWRALADGYATVPDARNFPLDPLKAGDAHVRKDDTRPTGGQPRDWWTYLYNRNVTDYTDDPDRLADPAFLARFAGPRDAFGPEQVRYVNWRLVMRNGSGPQPVAPSLDSFMLAWRFESP